MKNHRAYRQEHIPVPVIISFFDDSFFSFSFFLWVIHMYTKWANCDKNCINCYGISIIHM